MIDGIRYPLNITGTTYNTSVVMFARIGEEIRPENGINYSSDRNPMSAGTHRFYFEGSDGLDHMFYDGTNTTKYPKVPYQEALTYTIEPISDISPISPPYWHNSSIKLSLHANYSEGISNISIFYRYSVDNSSWSAWTQYGSNITVFNTSWSGTVAFDFPDGDGHYEFRSIACNLTDVPEVKNSSDAECGYDSTPPAVSIASPIANYLFNTSTVNISWIASDSGSGLNHCEIRVDSGAWVSVGNSTEYTYTLSDGHHTVDVRAFDNAGNNASDFVSFNVDTTSPVLEILSPSEGSMFNVSTVIVEWKGNDSNSGIDHYEVMLDTGAWIDVGNDTNHNFASLSDGAHTVFVKLIDNASNENISSVSFIVDTTPPELEITGPVRINGYVNNTNVTISWASSDNTSGIDHYEVWDRFVYYGRWIDVDKNTTYTFRNLTEGTYHSIYVKSVDLAGNERIKEITFTIDSQPPEIVYFYTFGCSYIANCTNFNKLFMWHFTDTVSGVERYRIRLDSEPWIDLGLRENYTFTNLTEGNHTAFLEVRDRAGNKVMHSIAFYTDLTPPRLSYIYPTGDNVPLNVTVKTEFLDWISICILNSTEPITWNHTRVNSTYYLFTPSENLSYNTTYHMHLLARDDEWNILYYNWTFKTAALKTVPLSIITGTVLGENGTPIPYASILIDSTINLSTDKNGSFSAELPPGNHTILVSKEGYLNQTLNISVNSGEKKDLGQLTLPTSEKGQSSSEFPWFIFVLIVLLIAVPSFLYFIKFRRRRISEPPPDEEDIEEDNFY